VIRAQLFHEDLAKQRGVVTTVVQDVPVPATYVPDEQLYTLYTAGCPGDGNPEPGQHALLALLALFGSATVVYWLLPGWRRRRLVPLAAAGVPAVAADTEALLASTDVRATVLVNAGEPRADGSAFGHIGRRYIELTSGLLTMHDRDPDGFRAILAHEIGHLRNRDLDVTYLTVALWRSFVGLSALALVLLRADSVGAATGLHLAVLWLAVYLTRNGLLRAREYEADAFSARDHTPALLRLLRHRQDRDRVWTRLAGTHPSAARRLAALQATRQPAGRTHDLSYGDAFAFGLVTWLAYPVALAWRVNLGIEMWELRHHLITNIELLNGQYPWTSLVVLVPAGAGLGVAVWRIASSGAPRRLLPLGLTLVLGALTALAITPHTSDLSARMNGAPLPVFYLGVALLTTLAFMALAVACLTWRRTAARHPHRRWSWLAGTYGALQGLAFVPNVRPWLAIILIGVPLLGLVATLSRPGRLAVDART
jgi:Zn-dependent protease with chaperone function